MNSQDIWGMTLSAMCICPVLEECRHAHRVETVSALIDKTLLIPITGVLGMGSWYDTCDG